MQPAEAFTIISKVTTPGSFLHTPTDEIRTRDLEKYIRRLSALDLHCVTLAEYHKVQRIPRGLRVSFRPTLFQENSEYCTKFKAILNKRSMDIIVLTIDFLQKEITELTTRIATTEQQLVNTFPEDKYKDFKSKLDKTISEFRNNLQIRKKKKFMRDTDDYLHNQVYRWRRGCYQPQQGYSPSSTSSDSEYGTQLL
ncbi:unnamed protein product [Ranitomeya imitator]|uniref:Uncharacterized protein n=1 Tax=Ranitomeya imitator TaxID=111125 RepID=A0ABN9KRZ5_9NEOB|nr:unnamed protein product [Ranitomeya imitator]